MKDKDVAVACLSASMFPCSVHVDTCAHTASGDTYRLTQGAGYGWLAKALSVRSGR